MVTGTVVQRKARCAQPHHSRSIRHLAKPKIFRLGSYSSSVLCRHCFQPLVPRRARRRPSGSTGCAFVYARAIKAFGRKRLVPIGRGGSFFSRQAPPAGYGRCRGGGIFEPSCGGAAGVRLDAESGQQSLDWRTKCAPQTSRAATQDRCSAQEAR